MPDRDRKNAGDPSIDGYDDSPDRVPGKRSLTQSAGATPMRSAWPGKRSAAQALPSSRSTGAGGGTPLHDGVRSRTGSSFGAEFAAVRVHEDASGLEHEADTLGAKAARGEYVGMFSGTSSPAVVESKTEVNPIAASLETKDDALGR